MGMLLIIVDTTIPLLGHKKIINLHRSNIIVKSDLLVYSPFSSVWLEDFPFPCLIAQG